ncbi:MAG: glycoside hydrolase family 127 protein [Abditibacteriota bacterium]|nr:glycoside hydrolase family 127 protein [Abditibacteriota bacterium]
MKNPRHTLDYKQEPVLTRDWRTACEFRGFFGEQAENLKDNWAATLEKQNPSMLELFRKREECPEVLPWSGEFPGKFLRSLVYLRRMAGDEELREYIYGFVGRIIDLQADNGYLGVWSKPYQLTGIGHKSICGKVSWDLWNHYHIMHGMLLWYEDTGDQRALDCAVKMADLVCEKFLDDPIRLAWTDSGYCNWAIGHSMAYLYKITGDEKYLKFCQNMIDKVFPDPHFNLNFLNRALAGEAWYQNNGAGGIRWEALHSALIIPEMYFLTGNEDYRTATENIFHGIARYDRHNNGAWTSMEQANGNPWDVRSEETCCTIAWEALGVEALRATGNSLYADELEVTVCNAALGFLSRDGRWTSYNTPMDGMVVPSDPNLWEAARNNGIDCCTVNAIRGLAIVTDWALMSGKEGPALNWYGDSVLTGYYKDMPVTLEVSGGYPRNGSVSIAVSPGSEASFTLSLRIPSWSRETSVSVNGRSVKGVKSGGYLKIKRDWQKGDRIDIGFDMSLRYQTGHEESEGKVCIYRGPVLLALQKKSPADYARYGEDWQEWLRARHLPYFHGLRSVKPGSRIRYEFEGDYCAWTYNRFNDAGIADVYIDGKLADTVDLYREGVDAGDLFGYNQGRKDLFLSTVWEKEGLGPGRHTLEIEVTGQKQEASLDCAVNVIEFLDRRSAPVIDVSALKNAVVKDDPEGTLGIAVQLRDTDGNTVTLTDYDSAAETGSFFATWIKGTGQKDMPYEKGNPFRLDK